MLTLLVRIKIITGISFPSICYVLGTTWSTINALSYLILHYSYFMNDVWSSNKFLKVRQLKSDRIVIQLKPNCNSISQTCLIEETSSWSFIDTVLWIFFSAVTILLFTVLQFTAIISLLHHILLSLFFFFFPHICPRCHILFFSHWT